MGAWHWGGGPLTSHESLQILFQLPFPLHGNICLHVTNSYGKCRFLGWGFTFSKHLKQMKEYVPCDSWFHDFTLPLEALPLHSACRSYSSVEFWYPLYRGSSWYLKPVGYVDQKKSPNESKLVPKISWNHHPLPEWDPLRCWMHGCKSQRLHGFTYILPASDDL